MQKNWNQGDEWFGDKIFLPHQSPLAASAPLESKDNWQNQVLMLFWKAKWVGSSSLVEEYYTGSMSQWKTLFSFTLSARIP